MTVCSEGPRYAAKDLLALAEALLVAAGMPAAKAAAVADILVEGDLLGHATHGLQLLPAYLDEVAGGGMTLEGEPDVVSDHGAALTWDGKRLPGPWLVLQAIEAASERARRFGIGAVSIRRSHHIAALATYARRVAEDGLVLVLLSSAPAGASVAPFGGTEALFSPSPIGVGIPTGGDPVCVDVSTSITTNTMTGLMARQGRKLAGAWAMDERGVVTDDPAVAIPPRKGTLLPLGGVDAGHKGYGLALMVEALTAGLAGHGRSDANARWGATLLVQVIDPQAFSGIEAFAHQMDDLVASCHANPPIDPRRPVRLPGERGLGLRRRQLQGGVALPAAITAPLWAWAHRLAVRIPVPA